jgi:hypothetical protein
VDGPAANATISGTVTISGWAVDPYYAADTSSGVLDVMVYRDGEVGAGGVLLGEATKYNRPDIDAAFGLNGSESGWSLSTDFSPVAAGSHTLYIYGLTDCGWAYATLPVVVDQSAPAAGAQPSGVQLNIDTPTSGASVAAASRLVVTGWAADPVGPGTGIDQVQITVDTPLGSGGTVATANYGKARPDVATATGKSEWTNSGYDYSWTVTGTPGQHTLYVYARSVSTGQQTSKTVTINVTGAPPPPPPPANAARPGGAINIDSPDSGATVRDTITMHGVAGDCGTGAPATKVRIYSGNTSGQLIGEARLNVNANLSSVCGSGAPTSGNFGWEFSLNTRNLSEGSRTITAAADFASTSSVSDSVSLTVDNLAGTNAGGGYYAGYANGYNNNCSPYNNYPYNNGYVYGNNNGYYSGYNSGYYNGYNNGYNNNCYPYNNGYYPGYPGGYYPPPGGYGNCQPGYIFNPSLGYCVPSGGTSGTCPSGVIVLDQASTTVPVSGAVPLTGYALVNSGFGSGQPATSVTITDVTTGQSSQPITVTSVGQPRTDAQSAYGTSALNSGYTATWNTSGLGGSGFSRILQVTASGAGCTAIRQFPVTVSTSVSGSLIVGFSSTNVAAPEGPQGGSNSMFFNVVLSAPSTTAISVPYSSTNGTAVAGTDFVTSTANGTLNIAPGQTIAVIVVQTIGNNTVEANKTFTLTLGAPTGGASLGVSTATGTITNDDV